MLAMQYAVTNEFEGCGGWPTANTTLQMIYSLTMHER